MRRGEKKATRRKMKGKKKIAEEQCIGPAAEKLEGEIVLGNTAKK